MIITKSGSVQIVEYKGKNGLVFEEHNCKGCDLCVWACPKKILKLDLDRVNGRGYNPAVVTQIDECTACGICAIICPDSVIKVERDV